MSVTRKSACFAGICAALTSCITLATAAPNTRHVEVSARTLVLGIQVDRQEARLLSYSVKERPFREAAALAPRAYDAGSDLILEVALVGERGRRFTRQIDFGPICMEHGPGSESHVEGDSIRAHRDGILVEMPELAGFERVQVAYYEEVRGDTVRRLLGEAKLDRARFYAAGSDLDFEETLVASSVAANHGAVDLEPAAPTPDDGPASSSTTSAVIWPEDVNDPDIYEIYGNPAEGDRRLNIVLIPDGYTYGNKALMEQHADELVDYFRASTPYKEHDSLINYTLVYAYSVEDGTDECDCNVLVDTAFGTGFPNQSGSCGSLANRCLSYPSNCDSAGIANLLAAEQRAPFQDETILMVNTSRYGGCGGLRATYAAASNQSTDLALHETGHSIAGLLDEYVSNNGCGTATGEINTSVDPVNGAWPEWINDIGPPHEGAGHWSNCVYRPEFTCEMRSLHQDFCAVCNQRWANIFFGHPRVTPTAPAESWSVAPAQVVVNDSVDFSVTTRFVQDPTVTNDIIWSVDQGGTPLQVASGVTSYAHVFNQLGLTRIKAEVIADTNFVKPAAYDGNRDIVTWAVDVVATICEVGCADGIPQCDADGDGLGDICDPCLGDALNSCFGPLAQDNTALTGIRMHTDGNSSAGCSGSVTDCRGKVWVDDFGYNQLADAVTCDLAAGCPVDATGIFGCTDSSSEELFRCAHEDTVGAPELSYSFDVPDGDYLVNLLLMNVATATDQAGERLFSVALNGEVPAQLANIDPVAASGGPCDPASAPCLPLSRSAIVDVVGGAGLEIELRSDVDQPLIQGIEILCSESTWYPDGDGDGFGVPSGSVVACYRPAGFAPNANDCDDTHADAYPGAEELCDGYDNDCDTLTDEDDDGDGHDVCNDCLDTEDWQWEVPGEVQNVRYDPARGFLWDPPTPLGSVTGIYSMLRSSDPTDFGAGAGQCVGENIVLIWYFDDYATPPPNGAYFYLMRAESPCGAGTLGEDSSSVERTGVACTFSVP